jgi:hypothetical protein
MITIYRAYLIIVLALGAWLIIAPVALASPNFGEGAGDFTIRITIDKTLVSPGDEISVTGSGAEADVAINVLIVPDPTSGAGALTAVEVTPDADGNFSTTLTVPDTAETGRYAVRAEQPPGNGVLVNQYYWVGICVNECTGESFGATLPETGGASPAGTVLSLTLSGLLVGTLAVQGVRRARSV